ncbi:MAG: hypothetical protein IJK02_08220 [Clostridia bacterium]|nr:hypothetical protein [Clostridia bacterium]
MKDFSDQMGEKLNEVIEGKLTADDFIRFYSDSRGTEGFRDLYAYQKKLFNDFQGKECAFLFCVHPSYARPEKNYQPADFSADLMQSVEVVTEYAPYGENGIDLGMDVVYVTPTSGNARKLYDTLVESEYAILIEIYYQEGFVKDTSVKGDSDCDGCVSAMDARLVLRASVGLESFAPGSGLFRNADIDADGNLTAEDARQILRLSVGLAD